MIVIRELPERTVAVVPHHGPVETVDATRRPLYQHLIMNELIGGPSILRFLDEPNGDRLVDALVTTLHGHPSDDVVTTEVLPAGPYAVLEYDGPVAGLAAARDRLRSFAAARGGAAGPLLQVHLMDEIEGATEQELQVPLHPQA